MRLLFECTYVYEHPHVNSGIQRVVRNVINNLPAAKIGVDVECLPVILKNDKVYAVKRLAPSQHDHTQERFEKMRNSYWLFHYRLEKALGLSRFPRLRHAVETAFRLGAFSYILPFGLIMLVLAPGRNYVLDADIQDNFEKTRNRYWLFHYKLEYALGLGRFPKLRRAVEITFRLGAFSFILPFGLTMLVLAPGRIHARVKPWCEQVRNRYWLIHHKLEQGLGLSRVRILRWPFWQLFRLGSLSFVLPWKLTELMAEDDVDINRVSELNCKPGDVLVLLDSSWHADFFSHAEHLKTQGVGIVAVVYDLIPLTHPQFCDAPLVKVFDQWFEWVADTADGFIAISETICDQVRADVVRRLDQKEAAKRWYHFFHLGSELDKASGEGHVRGAVRELFSGEHSIYLMVSTIEPRKNHAYLLDAFERLWVDDSQAVLCIVGRVGWKCAPLIARIKKHRELGRRLFMFNDLSDTELEFCYQRSRGLVFPSFVEGFGLPLVEAMQRGLPAMASDIPVFREIGADFLAYFDLNDPSTLAALVRKFEDSGKFPAARALNEWSWLGWRDSTHQLIQRITSNTLEQQSIATPSGSLQKT